MSIYNYMDRESSALASYGVSSNCKQNRSDVSDIKTDYSSIGCFPEAEILKEKPFVQEFFNMVDCNKVPIDNITPMNFTDPQQNQFAIGMLKAFEEFDKLPLPNGGLITQQFEVLAQKCADKDVNLMIGKDPFNNDIGVDGENLHQDHIFINFSEDMVKKQMEKDIWVMEKSESEERYEIKAMPLKDFVGPEEKDENRLLAKCAAYLLFHELFHVNSFLDCDCGKERYNRFKEDYSFLGDQNKQFLEALFIEPDNGELDKSRADDARNTIFKNNEYRECPGELELLNALQNKNVMRLYVATNRDLRATQKYTCCKLFEHIYGLNSTQHETIQNFLSTCSECLNKIENFRSLFCNYLSIKNKQSDSAEKYQKLINELKEDVKELKENIQQFKLENSQINSLKGNIIEKINYFEENNEKTNEKGDDLSEQWKQYFSDESIRNLQKQISDMLPGLSVPSIEQYLPRFNSPSPGGCILA